MNTLIFINFVIAGIIIILTVDIVITGLVKFKRIFPNVKINGGHPGIFIVSVIITVVKALIPIYNIFVLIGMILYREQIINASLETLINRITLVDKVKE